jgi:predicted amidophosphoribosyltransferase
MTSEHLRATAPPAATQHAARLDVAVGLVLATACPRCGARVPSATSDFCEHCSAHL